MRRHDVLSFLTGASLWGLCPLASASEPLPQEPRSVSERSVSDSARPSGGLGWRKGQYFHLYGSASLGRGIRLNNPYRLQTQLGDDAQSLSATAPYLDLGLGTLFGSPSGLQHGAAVQASFALSGIRQEVLTPSYVNLLRLSSRWQARGRVGIPIVIEPDASAGLELGLGAVFLVTAGLGVTADVIGSLFSGAATRDQAETWIPVASLQIGVLVDYEVLP